MHDILSFVYQTQQQHSQSNLPPHTQQELSQFSGGGNLPGQSNFYSQQQQLIGKKKRNRKRKNKEGKLKAEEIINMPTDDLCNYIENKANQNAEAAAGLTQRLNSMGPKQTINHAAQNSLGGVGKSKKRTGQSMSIEDQESRRQEKMLEDLSLSQLDQLTLSQQFGDQLKNMNVDELKSSLQYIKNQQRLKQHNFNHYNSARRGGDSYVGPTGIHSDHTSNNNDQIYSDEMGNNPCSGASCNYCKGEVIQSQDGSRQFIHDVNCCFRADYDSEEVGEQDMAQNDDHGDEYLGVNPHPPDYEEEICDEEGDREVEEFIKVIERQRQQGGQIRRKLRPNVSVEWIQKLREYLRAHGATGNSAPPQPSHVSAERVAAPQRSHAPRR